MTGSDYALQDAAAPARGHFAIVPSDTVDQPFRALFVSTTGNVAVVDHRRRRADLPGVAGQHGTQHSGQARQLDRHHGGRHQGLALTCGSGSA